MRLILFLLFIHNLMAQPGPTQTQEAGISNYQILATPPAGNPIPGKQYLYNANNILSTKDSAGSITRVSKDINNILANPDFEQNLDSYTFTAGRAVINTATPLFDKRSVDLDTSALNDNISTIPYLIPKGLQGQTCQAEINYSGGDNNLTMQVLNADNVVIGSKVLASAIDPTPAFIVFNCPIGTATINQRTLRINIIQNSATNAILATIDNFYLGKFQSNTMNVQGLSQWYYFTANADINGNFAFPAPTASTNDKTLFTYSGTTLTALKPVSINFNVYSEIGVSTTAQVLNTVTCNISGVSRMLRSRGNSNATNGGIVTQPTTFMLSPGDACIVNFSRTALTIDAYTVNITATPLPQLATIVNTNTPRAGLWASRTWAATAGCSWLRGTAAFGPFPAVAACGTTPPTNQGFSINDATLNGQLPQITLSKYPKGFHYITLNTELYANGSGNAAFRISDGINVSSIGHQASTGGVGIPSISFIIYNPTDRTNVILSVEANAVTIGAQILSDNTGRIFTMTDMYMPDLSDPYSIPELYAALPPQVINSSGKIFRYEACLVLNNGTASFGSPNCNNWIQTATRTAAGQVRLNFLPGIFSSIPQCNASNLTSGAIANFANKACTSTTNIEIDGFCVFTQSSTAATFGDWGFLLTCGGLQ